jgi:hypothetical protein
MVFSVVPSNPMRNSLSLRHISILIISIVVVLIFTPDQAYSRTSKDVNKEQTDAVVKAFSQFYAAFFIAHEMKLDRACVNFKGMPKVSVDDFITLLDPPTEQERLKLRSDLNEAISKSIELKGSQGKRMSEEMYLIQKEAIEKSLRLTESLTSNRLCDLLSRAATNLLNKSKETMKTAELLEKEMRSLEAKGK